MILIRLATILLLLVYVVTNAAAQDSSKRNLVNIISAVNNTSTDLAIEKIYVHTDKPAYNAGDTLWFKAYVFDACYLNGSSKSGLMYLEIATDSNKVVRRVMLPLVGGTGVGQISLVEGDMPQGNYVLTAYTNWMRNFSEAYIFKKPFYISAATNREWLINYSASSTHSGSNENINVALKLNRFDNSPVSFRNISMTVADERRSYFRERVETGIDGRVNLRFDLPNQIKGKAVSLTLQDLAREKETPKLFNPLILNRPDQIDLQFMPEGGKLVAGLPARVAVKALNEDGYSASVEGSIVDSKGKEVANFRALNKGTGVFKMLPQPGEQYSANLNLPGGLKKSYPLPLVSSSGITLQIDNEFKSDSCEVIVRVTKDVALLEQTYYLIGEARGLICYGAAIRPLNGTMKFVISKKIFPTGIVRFTVNTLNHSVLNERLIYIDHHDQLKIKLTTKQSSYRQRDSVELDIEVTDNNGNPVQGSFSLAVTDDGQVKTDSIKSTSLLSQLLLTSDLKGYIEDPGYYFQQPATAEIAEELDELLLTQGWTGYDRADMLAPAKTYNYMAEPTFIVKGKVTNAFNKPVAASPVTFMGRDPLVLMDTITNKDGNFSFFGVTPGEDAVFFLQSKNRKNKSFNVGIEMEEFSPPAFKDLPDRIIPWYVNVDTTILQLKNLQVALQKERESITGIKTLQEVIVTSRRIIKDSKNLNGPGEADIIISEEELEKAGRTTLGDLLKKNVSGFGLRRDKYGNQFYAINTMRAHLIIDGMNTEFFLSEGLSLVEYLRHFFEYYDAEEIKGIEVMNSGKYQMRYSSTYLDPLETPWNHAFIEVTTRGGKGPFLKKSVGTYLYKPMPLVLPAAFYSPKYQVASTPDLSDIRSTIFWEPSIISGKDGKATVQFFTADNPGRYSIIIEGSDMQGNVGIMRAAIKVEKRP